VLAALVVAGGVFGFMKWRRQTSRVSDLVTSAEVCRVGALCENSRLCIDSYG
jgi:hypothetical protein